MSKPVIQNEREVIEEQCRQLGFQPEPKDSDEYLHSIIRSRAGEVYPGTTIMDQMGAGLWGYLPIRGDE